MAGAGVELVDPTQFERKGMAVKVYIVLQDSNVGRPCEVIGTKLTFKAAQALVDRHVGARIAKCIADKSDLTYSEMLERIGKV